MTSGSGKAAVALASTSPTPTPVSTVSSPRARPSSSFHLFAGLASGLTTSLLLQPADLLKTRVQQSPSSSISSVIRHIYSTPRPLAQLWRGTLPSAVRTGFGSALYFGILNKMRSSLAGASASTKASGSSSLPKLSPSLNLISGAAARAFAGFVMMPVTVLKVRWESSIYGYKSLGAAFRDIIAERGLRGLFAGSGATALRDAPYAGLYVVIYEWSKGALGKLSVAGRGGDRIQAGTSASINFASGALAAATATAATNPPDAIKTRLQLMPGKYKNSLQAARLMLKEEGLRSMFDGLGLRMARKALSSALAWTLYEEVVRRAESRLYS